MKQTVADVLVIGAGPAGLAAASAAREGGAKRVLIVERLPYPGGILPQCIHDGFGVEIIKQSLTGPEYADRYIKRAEKHGVELWLSSSVARLAPDKTVLVVSKKALVQVTAKAVVMSMGCRERTRWNVLIPGTKPAGIYTAGVAQASVNLYDRMVGKNVIILGSGDVGLIMARRLTLEGAKVLAVVEKMPYPGGLSRNVQQCLHDFGIPLYLSHTVSKIHGWKRLEGVTVAPVGPRGGEKKGRFIACDSLLLSVGLIPENELSREIGIGIDRMTGGPLVDEEGHTTVPGFFACGNALHVHDLVDWVTEESERAGRAAGRWSRRSDKTPGETVEFLPVKAGRGLRYIVPQQLRAGVAVTFAGRVDKPRLNTRLRVLCGPKRVIEEFPIPFLIPSEMVRFHLPEGVPPGKEVTIELFQSHKSGKHG
jgi:NADPH-dependent 2,4-dienoyl-CoA reductase/sulfur reductase-like enzyme